jgi:hypothetical protein
MNKLQKAARVIEDHLGTCSDFEVAEFAVAVAQTISNHLTDDDLIKAADTFEGTAARWIDNYDPTPD